MAELRGEYSDAFQAWFRAASITPKILWFALCCSQAIYFVVASFGLKRPPEPNPEPWLYLIRALAIAMALAGALIWALGTRDDRLAAFLSRDEPVDSNLRKDPNLRARIEQMTERERAILRSFNFFFTPTILAASAFSMIAVAGFVEAALTVDPTRCLPYLLSGLALMPIAYPRTATWVDRAESFVK